MAAIIGAIIGGAMGGVSAYRSGMPVWQGILVGAAAGATMAGVGSAVGAAVAAGTMGMLAGTAIMAGTGAVVGAASSAAMGGHPGYGALLGGLGAGLGFGLAGAFTSGFTTNFFWGGLAAAAITGPVVGGLGAELNGGSFGSGALEGLGYAVGGYLTGYGLAAAYNSLQASPEQNNQPQAVADRVSLEEKINAIENYVRESAQPVAQESTPQQAPVNKTQAQNAANANALTVDGKQGEIVVGSDGKAYFVPKFNPNNAGFWKTMQYILQNFIWNLLTPPGTPNPASPPGQDSPKPITEVSIYGVNG